MKKLFFLGFIALTFGACNPDKNDTPSGAYASGVFITNEGNYLAGNGSLSFYNPQTGVVANDIYPSPLGDVVQSMSVFDNNAYIVVNNSNVVQVAEANTMTAKGAITGFELPRYFQGISTTKGYVSQWGEDGYAGNVAVVDLASKTITSTISVGNGPEALFKDADDIFVACSGGFGSDNRVSVINSTNNTVSQTITVGDNPVAFSNSPQLWQLYVLCRGKKIYNADYTLNIAASTAASIWKIDMSNNNTPSLVYTFTDVAISPSALATNASGSGFYFVADGSIKFFDTTGDIVPMEPRTVINRNFYALGYDKTNNILYASDIRDYASEGYVHRYNANTNHTAIDSFQVGIIPGNFCFKN